MFIVCLVYCGFCVFVNFIVVGIIFIVFDLFGEDDLGRYCVLNIVCGFFGNNVYLVRWENFVSIFFLVVE